MIWYSLKLPQVSRIFREWAVAGFLWRLGVGTRLISQPLTDRGLPATLTISRRSADVITSSPRQRVAQADTTSRLAADYDNPIGRRPPH